MQSTLHTPSTYGVLRSPCRYICFSTGNSNMGMQFRMYYRTSRLDRSVDYNSSCRFGARASWAGWCSFIRDVQHWPLHSPGSPSINSMPKYFKARRCCPVVQSVIYYYFFFCHGQLITTHQRWYKWAHLCSLLPATPSPFVYLPIRISWSFSATVLNQTYLGFLHFSVTAKRRMQRASKYRVVAVQLIDRNHFSSDKYAFPAQPRGTQ